MDTSFIFEHYKMVRMTRRRKTSSCFEKASRRFTRKNTAFSKEENVVFRPTTRRFPSSKTSTSVVCSSKLIFVQQRYNLTPPETQPATRNFFRFSLGARACVYVPYIYKIKIKKKNIPIGLRLRAPKNILKNKNATGLRVAFFG